MCSSGENMLESLELENFQCHEHVRISFDPGVNVIAGSSDAGKSALLRGILWLVTNRPQGLGFRNARAGKGDLVEASIVLDGRKIARRRSEQVNEYLLDGKSFVAMKNDVPTDIQAALNLLPVNIQTQFQPHYLLSASAGEVSKVLNESCDLSVIDSLLKGVKGIKTQSASEANRLTGEQKALEDEIQGLDWVDAALVLQDTIQTKMYYRDHAQSDCEALEKLVSGLEGAERHVKALSSVSGAFESLREVEAMFAELEQEKADSDALAILSARLLHAESTISRLRGVSIDGIPDLADGLSGLLSDAEAVEDAEKECKILQDLADKLDSLELSIEREQVVLEEVRTDLRECWGSVQVCPLCNQPLEECKECQN